MSNPPGASDSGRHERRSNFSHTCSLLSQYLKEKGSFGDIFDPAKGQAETARPLTTMDLLPLVEMWGSAAEEKALAAQPDAVNVRDLSPERADVEPSASRPTTVRSEAAQMTMFYAGRVLVFDNFPADRAKEIMLLANSTISPSSAGDHEQGDGMQIRNADVASTPGGSSPYPPDDHLARLGDGRPPQADASDLPIARKISLRRFLEKRKGRITAKAPYQLGDNGGKPEESNSWLALASKSDSEDS